MHYSDSICAIDFDKPTMEAKDGKKLGNKKGLAKVQFYFILVVELNQRLMLTVFILNIQSDIEEINRLYEC